MIAWREENEDYSQRGALDLLLNESTSIRRLDFYQIFFVVLKHAYINFFKFQSFNLTLQI